MKQRILTSVIVLSLLATMPAWGQTTVIKRTETKQAVKPKAGSQWVWKNDYSEGLACVIDKNNRYGFIDKFGTLVIPCLWKRAFSFDGGLAMVENDQGKYGYIDKTGKLVIPCEWDKTLYLREGMIPVKDSSGKWGFIDKNGTVVIACEWDWVDIFGNGLAPVRDNRNYYGFYNKEGNLAIPLKKWRDIGNSAFRTYFNDGRCKVQDENGKWGFIDTKGDLVIPCQWDWTGPFSEGLAAVYLGNRQYAYIDIWGKISFVSKYNVCGFGKFSDGLAPVRNENSKIGFIDKIGNLAIPCKWDDIWEGFKNGYAIVESNGRKVKINKKGVVVK